MWEWACELDRQDLLWFEFARPVEIEPGSPEDIVIQLPGRARILALHLPCDTIRIFHWIAGALPKRVR